MSAILVGNFTPLLDFFLSSKLAQGVHFFQTCGNSPFFHERLRSLRRTSFPTGPSQRSISPWMRSGPGAFFNLSLLMACLSSFLLNGVSKSELLAVGDFSCFLRNLIFSLSWSFTLVLYLQRQRSGSCVLLSFGLLLKLSHYVPWV